MSTMNTQIYEEASEWVILHRSDDLDADAKRRFDAWLRESPQHLRAYLEMSTIWEDVPALNPDWNPSADELIARVRQDANVFPLALKVPDAQSRAISDLAASASEPQSVPADNVRTSRAHLTKLLAVAATLILTAGAAGWLYLQRGIYTTDVGEQRTLALEDGSSVELNARTRIRVAYTDRDRTIELLHGQALFKVAKDPNRPFIVDSAGTRVRAVGTQFDVYRKSMGTQVTVVEGRVAVASTAPTMVDPASERLARSSQASSPGPRHSLEAQLGEVLLSAGEQILIAQNTPELALVRDHPVSSPQGSGPGTRLDVPVPKAANVEAATAWTQQRLVFDFSPLSEVAQEFNRYNRRPLIIDDPVLETFNISGSFSSTDPTLLLRFLREQPGIVVNETPDEIRISREDTHG